MKTRTLLIFVAGLCIASMAPAQSVVGLWNVTNVAVGDENMTPVAKWFKFTEDGAATGGNGWTQNAIGTYAYDEKTNQLSATNRLSIKDDLGPFKVSFSSDTMKWARQEEGMEVVVTLIPTKEWSPAPADLVKGLWALIRAEDTNGHEMEDYDTEGKQYLFIRPDMRFRMRLPDESLLNGFWHMDGHRPIITLINYDRSVENQVFHVSMNEGTMTMRSQDNAGRVYYYSRIHEFPE